MWAGVSPERDTFPTYGGPDGRPHRTPRVVLTVGTKEGVQKKTISTVIRESPVVSEVSGREVWGNRVGSDLSVPPTHLRVELPSQSSVRILGPYDPLTGKGWEYELTTRGTSYSKGSMEVGTYSHDH